MVTVEKRLRQGHLLLLLAVYLIKAVVEPSLVFFDQLL